jgi:hypothetical protein
MLPVARRFPRAPPTLPPAVQEMPAKRQRLSDLTGIDADFDVRFMDCFAVEIVGGDTVTINRTRHAV